MNVNQIIINVTSPDPQRLGAFYRDTVGLPPNPDMGEFAMMAGSTPFMIDSHSEVTGPTKEPARVLLSLMVDDIKSEQTRLEAAGVKFIRKEGKQDWGGVISTFTDPDGNYMQLIEYHPA